MMEAKPMRTVFGEALCELAAEYERLVVLDADVSSSTQTRLFGQQYPERFYNFGIAEANMVSAAAGMAAAGLLPVASTFAFLMTLRAGDPIRSLIAYNRLNVKLAGGYAGFSDFADGASHQSVMDLAVMRAMPNMTVLVPSDRETTRGAVRAMLAHEGPVYLRLSRDMAGSLHKGEEAFPIGKGRVIKAGGEITLAVCGTLLSSALEAAKELAVLGIDAAVLEFPTLKPFDQELLLQYANKTGAIVSIEEHSILGGLGGVIAESLSLSSGARLRRVGIEDTFGESGPYPELLKRYRMTASDIIEAAQELLENKIGV
ncbi:transketolase [Anaerotaenia torta]|uniref:transketolase family protein n=1 Tax=Anaerotaenia torta TaxID=433293 RepID=UPI003D2133C7